MPKKNFLILLATLVFCVGFFKNCRACHDSRCGSDSYDGAGSYDWGYYGLEYYDWNSSYDAPYVYDRRREIERNLRQVPYQSPYFYDRNREIERNLRQAPYRYYGFDGYLSDREALDYLWDYNIIN